MTLAAQLDADFRSFDGLKSVTLTSRRTDDNGDAVEVSASIGYALPSEVTYADQDLGVVRTSVVTRVWNLLKSVCDAESITPQSGDMITDAAGVEWSIRAVTVRSLDTRYRCVCEKGRL